MLTKQKHTYNNLYSLQLTVDIDNTERKTEIHIHNTCQLAK